MAILVKCCGLCGIFLYRQLPFYHQSSDMELIIYYIEKIYKVHKRNSIGCLGSTNIYKLTQGVKTEEGGELRGDIRQTSAVQ